jgi:anaerobic dimethyl sulfoxide reductase subunit A
MSADEPRAVYGMGPHNCGGKCLLRARVEGGRIVRIESDESPDSPESPALRACLRCRSYRNVLYHPDRLTHPLVRSGPRGAGVFRRASWSEALSLVADGLRAAAERHGPSSRLVLYGWGDEGALCGANLMRRLLNCTGGQARYYNNYSNAATSWATALMLGTAESGSTRSTLLHSRLIVLWGHNPAETIFDTNTSYYLRLAKDAGAEIVVIDPRLTDSAVGLADQWIPIRPTTDAAFGDAVAHTLVAESLQDQAFLDRACVGFDDAHMPAGAPPELSYRAWLEGRADGTPKSAEWAAPICGVPADVIRAFARKLAALSPAAILSGYGPQRHAYGEQHARAAIALAAMTGNVGVLGGWASGKGGYARSPRGLEIPLGHNPVAAEFPVFRWTDAVERGLELGPADGVRGAERLPSPVRAIFQIAGNTLANQHADLNRTRRILEREDLLELIVVSDLFLTPSARFADVVLPATAAWERQTLYAPWDAGDYVGFGGKAVEPPGEVRDDYDWISELAGLLGAREAFTEGRTREDWLRAILDGARARYPGLPGFEELRAAGVHRFSYPAPHVAFARECADPARHPFATPSGRLELFSQALHQEGHPAEKPPIPKYVPAWEGPEDPLARRYPLQLIGFHTRRRAHTIQDNDPWMEECGPQVMWMNAIDAAARRIEDGDSVRVENDRGALRIRARVTPRIMPGVVAIPQGAWARPAADGVDEGGSINVLTSQRHTPMAFGNAQHTCLVEVRRQRGARR